MSEQQNPTTQGAPVFSPVKDNPAAAAKFVLMIFKNKPHDVDLVAAELAPLYGFGPNSNRDVLARSKAQGVFVCPEILEPLKEFQAYFTHDKWGLPLPKWDATLALVHEHSNTGAWTGPGHPVLEGGSPEQYYARFLILMLHELELPVRAKTHMIQWLRDAVRMGKEDNVCWVLFHALFYLQLKAMDLNKSRAPFKDRMQHYINRFSGPDSYSDLLSKWIAVRRGLGEVSLGKY
ncbi:hypothetical protein E0Z10_g5477 [Xylaria hypoxylon]|uniref:Uncharacterized protein n=1 Tax=Xylaria hypoxylon TaxID=37992 RepID=A0A4Z0Z3P0_9PEZI|nr:hypothetical protein E0Z10_g5477 [Xylaria hypoxylon]